MTPRSSFTNARGLKDRVDLVVSTYRDLALRRAVLTKRRRAGTKTLLRALLWVLTHVVRLSDGCRTVVHMAEEWFTYGASGERLGISAEAVRQKGNPVSVARQPTMARRRFSLI